jgi:three-Cys-motif partner protein
MDALPPLENDGLATPDVGAWAEEKYQLVRYYADIFSRAMAKRWTLVYVDLFAAAGHATIRDSGRIIPASPVLVLDLPKPFSKYIFSELDPANASALEMRAARHAPNRDVFVLRGDTNANVRQIVENIPENSLSFCFADPFNIENLRFATVETLAESRRVDFLVLLASGMDANRNEAEYVKPANKLVERFTGAADWRRRWPHATLNFGDFVADEFGRSMKRLGYRYEGLVVTKTIVNSKNAPMYRLAFFSRNDLGMKFWYESLKYTTPQRKLF